MEQTIYLDTRADYSIEDYKEHCQDNGIELDENKFDEQAYYDWCNMMCRIYIDDFWENLKYSHHKDDKVIITGMLGLWYGKREIYPELTTLEQAIRKCIGNSDDYKIFVDEDGELNIFAYHHDGTNCFDILFLTEYGAEHFEEDEWNDMSEEEKEKCFSKGDLDYLF